MSKKTASTNEIGKYAELEEKLFKTCAENSLTYSIQNKQYPFLLIIKPVGGMDAQQTMIEGLDDGDTGYISPEAVIVFAYKDGDLTYKMSETINISDALFNKIKNLFKKMYACYMAYFFRDRTENCSGYAYEGTRQAEEHSAADTEAQAVEPDEFAEFFDDAAKCEE